MGKRQDLQKQLKEKGIKFDRKYSNEDMEALLNGQTIEKTKTKPDSTLQLVDVIQNLSKSVQAIGDDLKAVKAEVAEMKKPVSPTENVLSITKQVQPDSTATYLAAVPADMLRVASEILGSKFMFECDALTDQPSFAFTVIVPDEYTLPQFRNGQDRRTRVIENVLGVNGVRDWCVLVKQNIIKQLGRQLTQV